jgi:hypothetical protein
MKPVLLYSLPRARSTATLHSCTREIKLSEPFGTTVLNKNISHRNDKPWIFNQDKAWAFRAELNNNVVSSGQWDNLVKQMSNCNTVTKILSSDLQYFLPARSWFEDVVEKETHDVFVIERENREERVLSFIIAHYFGWAKKEIDSYEFTVHDKMLNDIHSGIDWYLRYYPKKGKIITFENLPKSHFDKNLNNYENQNSSSKYQYIKNLDEIKQHIKHILDYYKDTWDSKIRNLDQS